MQTPQRRRRPSPDELLPGADLRGVDLRYGLLTDLDLSRADLAGADLSNALLERARLRDANLSGAILSRARLDGADLSGANLTGAVLDRSVLTAADMGGANLSQASFIEALMGGANLDGTERVGAKGLEWFESPTYAFDDGGPGLESEPSDLHVGRDDDAIDYPAADDDGVALEGAGLSMSEALEAFDTGVALGEMIAKRATRRIGNWT